MIEGTKEASSRMNFVVGVDGCKSGWFAVMLTGEHRWKAQIFPCFGDILDDSSGASVILVDIPIGMRDVGFKERGCDLEARKLLGPQRGSSVFRVPCRSATDAKTYEEACSINSRITGKALSRQTWNIIPKIKEVDSLLRIDNSARLRVRESHPEVCFRALSGHAMHNPKRTEEGFQERVAALRYVFPRTEELLADALSAYRRREVGRDDILDALVLAAGYRAAHGQLCSIPEIPEYDSEGLPMEIVFPLWN